MIRRRYIQIGAGLLVLGLVAWAASRGLERLVTVGPSAETAAAESTAPAAGGPHITATMFYAAAEGDSLVQIRQEVALAASVVQQGREIVTAQLQGAAAPYVSVIPQGTVLRAFYVTDRGDAFVDLSSEVSSNHPGGTSTELLTVYAIVNAVTANLPTIRRVQILIGGAEADTLAGHVDVRRPLEPDLSLVRESTGTQ